MSARRQAMTADGDTQPVGATGPVWVSISGGFGSGTVTLKVKDPEAGTFNAITEAAFTEAVDKLIDFPVGVKNVLMYTVSGSTTPTLVIQTRSV